MPKPRPVVVVLIVLQILVPAIMLAARISDPSAGQMLGGWQMHTGCWGVIGCPPVDR